jgi:hypothetical protein
VPTVHSEDELPFTPNHPDQPLSVWGKRDRKGRPDTAGFRQNTYEADHIRRRWLSSKWIFCLQLQEIAAFAQRNFRFEGQLAKQRSSKFCAGSGFANNEGARSTHVQDTIATQFPRKDARAKPSVSANIDTPEEDDKGHTPDYEEKSKGTLEQPASAVAARQMIRRLQVVATRLRRILSPKLDDPVKAPARSKM